MSDCKTGTPIRNLQPISPQEPKAGSPGEHGVVLPVVLLAITFLYTLMTLFILQISHAKEIHLLYGEKVACKYAAESGIAVLQQQLRLGKWKPEETSREQLIRVGGRQVVMEMIKNNSKQIHIRATAWGKHGVIQTAEACLDPGTFAIRKWIR
ncbi:hypothetical protein [Thermoactinomyces mirandus]|uniref:Uncharacterized protein n=1 Tax=Thermoactinomyces mirandus TaxID=2756294 RepID=A0A7W1XUF0_9BACL|nr:hypothetical protein [Thermoactinomyces mirandus]MBA4603459.1 hypothetical protein [Thermoactinomyces mirandus]